MKFRLKKGLLPVVFLLLSAGVLGLALFVHASGSNTEASALPTTSAPPDGLWNDTKESYWGNEISSKGGAEAYKEFALVTLKDPGVMQHSEAHAFGRLLFEVEGIKGISVCDMQFSMGCYHEFIGQAVAHEGTAILAQLSLVCGSLPDPVQQSGCRHSIGHGLQAWLGYNPADLLKGLAMCKELPGSLRDIYGGCSSGLYMEYNLRIMAAGASAAVPDVREVKKGNYYEPCDIVPAEDLQGCVFWLPQWWESLPSFIDSTLATKFSKTGTLCRTLPFADVSDACFRGIGATVSGSTDSLQSVFDACKAASATDRENLLCRGFVAVVYRSQQNPDTDRVCDGLVGSGLDYCKTYQTGSAGLLDAIPLPANI